MKRRAFIGAAAAAYWLQAMAAEPIAEQVSKLLASDAVLRGEFEQRKTIKGFKNPLVSRGDFLVVRSRGVVWRTREPFLSSLVVTRDRLTARQADGSVSTQLNAREEPALRAINEMLFALLAGDLPALAQRFRIEGELRAGNAWQLVLVPREAGVARVVSRIDLEGDRFVRQVRLAEAQGDGSVIRFSQQSGAASPTAEEAGRFD